MSSLSLPIPLLSFPNERRLQKSRVCNGIAAVHPEEIVVVPVQRLADDVLCELEEL